MNKELAELLSCLTTEEQNELDQLLTERDPLVKLLDPEFKAVSWEYEFSRTDAEIPGSLHPKQQAALSAQQKHRWLFWGNQVGKTTLGAVDLVLLGLGRHPFLQRWEPPITAWASALTWELWEKILLPELLTWIPQDRIIDAPRPHQKSTKRDILIRADNGKISRITGKAAEQGADKYQSARVHAVWLDEEHPESVWDEMQPRLLRHGGITLATMTPLKGLTWVYHRVYEPWKAGTGHDRHFISHAGLADNPSVKPEEIEAITEELKHNPSQLAARLYGQFVRPQGLVLPFDAEKHFADITPNHVQQWMTKDRRKAYAAIDFGLWRFAFGLAVETPDGGLALIDEFFSQRESLETRARKMHKILYKWGIPADVLIVGDCANPQDILELNLALDRIGSPYRVAAIDAEKKIIRVGIERIENLLNRQAFMVRKGLGEGQVWYLGMSAAKQGKPVMGSRWVWEINNWQYPNDDKSGKAQKDVPDDDSADGADMMAMSRYMVMAWWEKQETRKPARDFDQHPGYTESGKPKDMVKHEEIEQGYSLPEYTLPTQWSER